MAYYRERLVAAAASAKPPHQTLMGVFRTQLKLTLLLHLQVSFLAASFCIVLPHSAVQFKLSMNVRSDYERPQHKELGTVKPVRENECPMAPADRPGPHKTCSEMPWH